RNRARPLPAIASRCQEGWVGGNRVVASGQDSLSPSTERSVASFARTRLLARAAERFHVRQSVGGSGSQRRSRSRAMVQRAPDGSVSSPARIAGTASPLREAA